MGLPLKIGYSNKEMVATKHKSLNWNTLMFIRIAGWEVFGELEDFILNRVIAYTLHDDLSLELWLGRIHLVISKKAVQNESVDN